MYMSPDSRHASWAASKPAADPGDVLGESLCQESADCVNNNCNESFEPEHASMVALSGLNVKTGKCGYPAFRGEVAAFSRLFKIEVSR